MREKGQTEVAKTLETPVFSRGIEILTEKLRFDKELHNKLMAYCEKHQITRTEAIRRGVYLLLDTEK